MNSYSPLQRFLHRFVLSSKFMREVVFEVEKSVFLKKEHAFKDNHVFVTGLARSGTTMLLNAIYKSNQFASLTYDDMPFILAPNFWKSLNPTKVHAKPKERIHGDGLMVTTNSPEAFEEIFWKTFGNDSKYFEESFKDFISLVLIKNAKCRYLSKNNQNIRRLTLINEIFPHSKFLILFRDPLQQAFSLLYQHRNFIKKQNQDPFTRSYMDWIGHSEFGLDYKMIHSSKLQYPNEKEINHWLEQWYLTYKSFLKISSKDKAINLIGYELLCDNPKVWINVKNILGINKEINFSFKKSSKDIESSFDNKLSDKCYKLYESLLLKAQAQ